MTQGRVSPAWARHHHKLWYDEVMRPAKRGDETALPHREPGDAAASRPKMTDQPRESSMKGKRGPASHEFGSAPPPSWNRRR